VNDILADTHVAIWVLFEPVRLSAASLKALPAPTKKNHG
jgi:hypothetical protein